MESLLSFVASTQNTDRHGRKESRAFVLPNAIIQAVQDNNAPALAPADSGSARHRPGFLFTFVGLSLGGI